MVNKDRMQGLSEKGQPNEKFSPIFNMAAEEMMSASRWFRTLEFCYFQITSEQWNSKYIEDETIGVDVFRNFVAAAKTLYGGFAVMWGRSKILETRLKGIDEELALFIRRYEMQGDMVKPSTELINHIDFIYKEIKTLAQHQGWRMGAEKKRKTGKGHFTEGF